MSSRGFSIPFPLTQYLIDDGATLSIQNLALSSLDYEQIVAFLKVHPEITNVSFIKCTFNDNGLLRHFGTLKRGDMILDLTHCDQISDIVSSFMFTKNSSLLDLPKLVITEMCLQKAKEQNTVVSTISSIMNDRIFHTYIPNPKSDSPLTDLFARCKYEATEGDLDLAAAFKFLETQADDNHPDKAKKLDKRKTLQELNSRISAYCREVLKNPSEIDYQKIYTDLASIYRDYETNITLQAAHSTIRAIFGRPPESDTVLMIKKIAARYTAMASVPQSSIRLTIPEPLTVRQSEPITKIY